MILLCSFIAWGLTLSGLLTICYNGRAGIQHLYQLHRVPCSKCQYFTNSCYLKCTVSTHLACTEQAIGCRDFAPIPAEQQVAKSQQPKSYRFKYTLDNCHEN
jgi:hypothetical protein